MLFKDLESVAKALALYHQGRASIYGAPFILSPLNPPSPLPILPVQVIHDLHTRDWGDESIGVIIAFFSADLAAQRTS